MEFYRWILIITGVVLLAVAYLMGSKKTLTHNRVSRGVKPVAYDPEIDELSASVEDRLYDNLGADPVGTGQQIDLADEDLDHSLAEAGLGNSTDPGYANNSAIDNFDEIDYALDERDNDEDTNRITSFAGAVSAASAGENSDSESGYENNFTDEFEVYHEPLRIDDADEKLVSVNVVAASGRRFYGNDLKALFDKHGYTHGRMSLYHCSLDGGKVFSVANMVKPGTFDESQMRSFETPGITLFMRLPIELDSDVAFDFLIGEAKELAEELDGQLRDANRNPLSEQTIQHMREDMQQYVFRTKRVQQPAT